MNVEFDGALSEFGERGECEVPNGWGVVSFLPFLWMSKEKDKTVYLR